MNADKLAAWPFRMVLIPCVVLVLDSSLVCAAEEATATGAATVPTDEPAAPMSEPAAWSNKLTLSYYYFSSGNKGVDLNLRHSFESSTGWIGAYRETLALRLNASRLTAS
jgi:hypothetical protein